MALAKNSGFLNRTNRRIFFNHMQHVALVTVFWCRLIPEHNWHFILSWFLSTSYIQILPSLIVAAKSSIEFDTKS